MSEIAKGFFNALKFWGGFLLCVAAIILAMEYKVWSVIAWLAGAGVIVWRMKEDYNSYRSSEEGISIVNMVLKCLFLLGVSLLYWFLFSIG